MSTIDDILAFNKKFVEEESYKRYETDKYPDKKLAIVSCMDTRLVELLEPALGIRRGEVKMIKTAGPTAAHEGQNAASGSRQPLADSTAKTIAPGNTIEVSMIA